MEWCGDYGCPAGNGVISCHDELIAHDCSGTRRLEGAATMVNVGGQTVLVGLHALQAGIRDSGGRIAAVPRSKLPAFA